MRRFALLCAMAAVLAGCGPSTDALKALAEQGAIEEDAPVKAAASIVIAASPAKVWAVLANIRDWPKWQPDITETAIAQDPALGVPFSWSPGDMSIASRIAVFEPEKQIGWTGRVYTIRAIHLWRLTPLPDGRTEVATRESMSGWLISFFYSSPDLLDSQRRWLDHLKQAAEG